MTVYDLPHCNVEPVGEPVGSYVITTEEGWYIHLTKRNPQNHYKTAVMLNANYDWSSIEIVAAADLPPVTE